MEEADDQPKYDLEEWTFQFARRVRAFVKCYCSMKRPS